MAFELKESYGNLFKNTKKESENQPDYKGEIMVNGELMSLAGWIKEGKNGKFFSLKISSKNHKSEPKQTNGFYQPTQYDQSLPF